MPPQEKVYIADGPKAGETVEVTAGRKYLEFKIETEQGVEQWAYERQDWTHNDMPAYIAKAPSPKIVELEEDSDA